MATELPAIQVMEEEGQNPTAVSPGPKKAPPAPQPKPDITRPADDDPDPFSTVFNQNQEDNPTNIPTIKTDEAKPGKDKKEETPGQEGKEAKEGANKDEPKDQTEAEPESFGAKHFKRLKEIHKNTLTEKESEIEKLKAQVAEASKVATPEEIKAIQEERDELLKRLEQVALERSPAFQAKHSKAINAALSVLKEAGGAKGEELEKIASMAPGAPRKAILRELLNDEDALTQAEIGSALVAYDAAVRAKTSELEEHKAAISEYSKSMSAKEAQEAELTAAKKQIVLKTVLEDAKKSYVAFQEIEGDADHNKSVRESEAELAHIINNGLDTDMLGVMYVVANEGKRVIDKVLPEKEARIKELEATIAKLSGSGASPGSGTGAPAKSSLEKTFEDVFFGEVN